MLTIPVCTPQPPSHMFGRQAALPVDLMYHKTPESENPAMYAAQLEHALVEAYECVRKCTGMKQRCQKKFCNRKVLGLTHKVGIKVWLNQSAVPRDSSKNLHHLWTGPYLVVQRISVVNY